MEKWSEVKWRHSVVSNSATPWTAAYQAPPSMGFSGKNTGVHCHCLLCRQPIKKQWIDFANKVRLVKAVVFPVVIHGCEIWTIEKAECHRIDPFEQWCWRGPLDCKATQPVNTKGNQSWIFIGRTDVKAEVSILWPPDLKSWLIRKDPDTGKDWRH